MNIPTAILKKISKEEGISLGQLKEFITSGRVTIAKNRKTRNKKFCGIGKSLSTKVNANIGTSSEKQELKEELKKLKAATEAGADTIMDLSTGGDLKKIRKEIIAHSSVPVGTVPIYEAAIKAAAKYGTITKMGKSLILNTIEQQADEGVDFMTVHSGVTEKGLAAIEKDGRLTNIVSRGGSFLAVWMITNKKENPLYDAFDEIVKIAKKYNITLSLGDGLRPGSIADSTDKAQLEELTTIAKQANYAVENGVSIFIEGPGHIPIDEIETNVKMAKNLCEDLPLYLLGPLVTDVAPGYDHITAAIGGAIAASFGADFLCFVTPAEHLKLPDVKDIREGVIAARIAAHVGDIAKGVRGARAWDNEISKYRNCRNWKKQELLSIDPERFREYHQDKSAISDVCTMCGEYCALKMVEKLWRKRKNQKSKNQKI